MPIQSYNIRNIFSAVRRMVPILTACAVISLPIACGHSSDSHDHNDEEEIHATHDHDHDHDHKPAHDHDPADHDHHHDHDHPADHKHSEAADDGHSGEIILTPAQAKAAGVVVSEINPGPFHQVIPTSGRVLSASGAESTAVATQAGIVRLARPWTQGMAVGAGAHLFTITNSHLPEGNVSSRAAIEYRKAKADFERTEKLYADQLVTRQEYETARADYERARLTYEATGSGAKGGTGVSAPKGGYVLACLVKDGDYVDVGTPLMTLTANRRLQLQADLPGRLYGQTGNIISARFRPAGADRTYSLADLNGRIVSHATQIAPGSTFVPVIFEFDNAPGIVAGSYAEVYLLGAPQEGVISVPRTALSEEQGIYCVYVQLDAEGYERRVVTTGRSDGENVEILSGLHPGEKVVTRGATHVRLASASKAIPGHTHEH